MTETMPNSGDSEKNSPSTLSLGHAPSDDVDLLCLGELIVDLLPVEGSQKGRKLPDFRPMPGGAPGNVAVGVAKLGFLSMFAGQVGDDFWGEFLAQSLQDYKVDISALHHSSDHPTPLAFVHLAENGERSFSFQRYNSADLMYSPEMLPEDLKRCRIFHFGSLTLTQEPARSSTLCAAQSARQAGALMSFDPNDRPALWELAGKSRHKVRLEMLNAMCLADVVKVSEEELLFLTSGDIDEKQLPLLRSVGSLTLIDKIYQQKKYTYLNATPDFKNVYDPQGYEPQGFEPQLSPKTELTIPPETKKSPEKLEQTYLSKAKQLLKLGPKLICVTLGEQGVLAISQNHSWQVSSPMVQAIDTTGAGDGFVAGLLAALLKHFKNTADLRRSYLVQLQEYSESRQPKTDWLQFCLQQACAVGALATTKKGALSALPNQAELKAFQDNSAP